MQKMNQYFFGKHLEDDELLLLLIHKHWLVGIRFMFLPAVFLLATVFFAVLVPHTGFRLLMLIALAFSGVWGLRNFFDFYLDAWLLTDHGIVDVEWHGWFHRQSSRILYSDIQGVSYEIQGLWGTLMNFGTVSIEKISTGSKIAMDFVPNPRRVEMSILKHMENYLHQRNLKDAKQVQDILSAVISREINIKSLRK